MRNSRAIIAMVGVTFVIAIGAVAGTAANAAIVPTIGLGTAASFSVLAGTPVISSTGLTTIDRDVGIHPAATIAPTAAPIVASVPTAAPVAVAGKQGLPATSSGDPTGPLTMLGVALTGIGIILLRGRPVRHL